MKVARQTPSATQGLVELRKKNDEGSRSQRDPQLIVMLREMPKPPRPRLSVLVLRQYLGFDLLHDQGNANDGWPFLRRTTRANFLMSGISLEGRRAHA